MLKRLLLIPLGLVVGLLAVELTLHGLSWIARTQLGAGLAEGWLAGSVRVLCLGDSNTYGVYVERDQAYPARLQAIWDAEIPSPKLEVMNLGIPGTNSSRLLLDLRSRLETFSPDIVIVLVGANDFWTLPFPLSEEDAAGSWLNTLRRRSRIYRYFYMVWRDRQTPEIRVSRTRRDETGTEHRIQVGDQEFEVEWTRDPNAETTRDSLAEDSRALHENLVTLARRVRESGAELYLMSYPSRFRPYTFANQVIRRLPSDEDIRYVDLRQTFAALCESTSCPQLLFQDGHPNAEGYEVVARQLRERLASDRPFP